MFKSKTHFVLCFLALLFFATYNFQETHAQIGHGGQPYSFSHNYLKKHIKNTYLKKVEAPLGVNPKLLAWMEIN